MKTRLINLWEGLRTSFWFVPAVMAVAAAMLAVLMLQIDQRAPGETIENFRWLHSGDSDAARSFLSTIASSIITVTGVVFSITIVVLSQASAQLGPRLLRNFMRDRGNQIVMGAFVATFIYCVAILRSIREIDDESFVPHLSVTIALLLAVSSLGFLIYFIHHISYSIQAQNMVTAVARDLEATIGTLFPKHLGHPPPPPETAHLAQPLDFDQHALPVTSSCSGYLTAIDSETLLELAVENDIVLRLNCRPGHFLVKGSCLLWVHPGSRINDDLTHQLNEVFLLAPSRTVTQDLEFAIEQLVEIAVRALSPSFNDPFTAIACIDRLSSALCEVARREMPSPCRYDDQNNLRVIAYPQTFHDLIDAAFNQIRQHGAQHPAVAIRFLEAVSTLARCVHQPDARQTLHAQADAIYNSVKRAIQEQKDLENIESRYLSAVRALNQR